MSRVIFLDSGPLSLVTHEPGVAAADACRGWLAGVLSRGERVVVAEIVDYELRRELIRANKVAAVTRLDAFNRSTPDRFLPITTTAMRLAAGLWATARQHGIPTSDPKELDIDVVLAAQALSFGIPPADLVVATTNVVHLARFLSADLWQNL